MIPSIIVRQRLRREFRQLTHRSLGLSPVNLRLSRCYSSAAIGRSNTSHAEQFEQTRKSVIDTWKERVHVSLGNRTSVDLASVQYHLFDAVNEESRTLAIALVADASARIDKVKANPYLSRIGREYLVEQIGDLYGSLSDRLHAYLDHKHLELLDDLVGPDKPARLHRPPINDTPWDQFSFPERL